MKAESRGKYPGLKLHLDDEECKALLAGNFPNFEKKVVKTIKEVKAEHPEMLEQRTQAQVVKSLKRDYDKIVKQLSAIEGGVDWKAVK